MSGALPNFLVLGEVATMLRVSEATIRRMVSRREIPFHQSGNHAPSQDVLHLEEVVAPRQKRRASDTENIEHGWV